MPRREWYWVIGRQLRPAQLHTSECSNVGVDGIPIGMVWSLRGLVVVVVVVVVVEGRRRVFRRIVTLMLHTLALRTPLQSYSPHCPTTCSLSDQGCRGRRRW